MQQVIKNTTQHFEEFHYSKAKAEIDLFFWRHFCDYYLEIVKDRLYKPEVHGNDSRLAGQMTLNHVLLGILKMFAPVMPFITEEVYSWYFANNKDNKHESLHTKEWPEYDKNLTLKDEQISGDLACNIISAVRKFKSDNQVSQKQVVEKLIISDKETELTPILSDLKMTLSIKEIVFEKTDAIPAGENLFVDATLEKTEKEV